MNTFGERIKLSIFGDACSAAVGMVLDCLPPGEPINEDLITQELNRVVPGMSELGGAQPQAEAVITSGVFQGKTTGAPVFILVQKNQQPSHLNKRNLPRPGSADYASLIRYGGHNDYRAGGMQSENKMAAITAAGAVAKQILARKNIRFQTAIVQVGNARGSGLDYGMKKEILDARASGDSVGSALVCTVTGVPAGMGDPLFSGMESRLAAILFSIPGVRGVEFGAGGQLAFMRGSGANDPICLENGQIMMETNNSGGINGGITNGMPLLVRISLAPSYQITREQRTVDLDKMESATIRMRGRNEPCLAPRRVPVLEAALALALLDTMDI